MLMFFVFALMFLYAAARVAAYDSFVDSRRRAAVTRMPRVRAMPLDSAMMLIRARRCLSAHADFRLSLPRRAIFIFAMAAVVSPIFRRFFHCHYAIFVFL